MKQLMIAVVLVGTLTGVAADASYTWVAADKTLLPNGGGVTVACDGDTANVLTLTANPTDGGTVTIGGDPMAFADGATITLASSGTVSFAEKVTTLGATTLARGDGAYLVWKGDDAGARAYVPNKVENMFELFPYEQIQAETESGWSLDAWEAVSSVLRYNPNHTKVTVRGVLRPGSLGEKYMTGTKRYCMNSLNVWTGIRSYGARLQLMQTNQTDGICARLLLCTQSELREDLSDRDMYLTIGKVNTDWFASDTINSKSSGIAIDHLMIHRIGSKPVRVRFDGGAALGGDLTINAGVEGVLTASEGSGMAVLSTNVKGDGDFRIEPMAATEAFAGTGYLDGFISSSTWQVLAENRYLASMTNIVGYMQGGGHNAAGTPSKCGTFHYHYNADEDTATCQFHFKRTEPPNEEGHTTKFVVAKLRQNGPNVEIAGVGQGYGNPGAYGTEFPTKNITTEEYTVKNWSSKVATLINESVGYSEKTNYASGYGIRKVTAYFGGATARGFAEIDGSLLSLTGGTFTVSGKDGMPMMASISSLAGLPYYGDVHVDADAELRLQAPGDAAGSGTSRLIVHAGGTLRNINPWQTVRTQQLVLDGGTYSGYSTTLYLQYVTLSNANMIGTSPRVATDSSIYWHVIGTEPSTMNCNNGINVYGLASEVAARNGNRAFRVDVEDVTNSADADFIVKRIRGACDRSDSQTYAWFWFEKHGPGTMELSGNSKEVRLESRLYGGTLLLAGDGIMTNAVQLLGGNLAVAEGAQNALGDLSATTNGTLTVGAGGLLSFASFTPGEELAAKAITIDAPMTGNTLRFGTDANGLTKAQLAYFRWKDATDGAVLHRVKIDDAGYVHPLFLGLTVSVR